MKRPSSQPHETLSQQGEIWLKCACGYDGLVIYSHYPPEHCPNCDPQAYHQLTLVTALPPPQARDVPAGWDDLTPEQKALVERYIATLQAEQLKLF